MKLRNKSMLIQLVNGKRVRPYREVSVEDSFEYDSNIFDLVSKPVKVISKKKKTIKHNYKEELNNGSK